MKTSVRVASSATVPITGPTNFKSKRLRPLFFCKYIVNSAAGPGFNQIFTKKGIDFFLDFGYNNIVEREKPRITAPRDVYFKVSE